MAYKTPTMNLTANLWRTPNVVTAVPDRAFVCNLAYGRRTPTLNMLTMFFVGTLTGEQNLLCPKGTDISGIWGNGATFSQDCVEVPAGSGRYYIVASVVDIGKGFSNEYRLASIMQMNEQLAVFSGNPWGAAVWPVPTP